MGVYGFGIGGFTVGADRVALPPRGCLLLGTNPGLDLLERLGQECQVPAPAVGVAGALQAVGAGTTGLAGEEH